MEEPIDKLPIDDNLSLDVLNVPKLPSDILFPCELNKHLRDRIEDISKQNQSLKSVIDEKNNKISEAKMAIQNLEEKLKQLEHFSSTSTHSSHTDLASTKIVELSKKIRELNAEVESHKTKCSRLENKVKLLTVEQGSTTKSDTEEKREENPDQVKLLSDKLAITTKKLFEVKNQNIQLSTELKQANRLLAQEIGDGFTSITNLSHGNSNFRGRAQQIISLQQKVVELQDKLSQNPVEREVSSNTIAIRQIESNKRQVQEQLNRELSTTKINLDETKKKLDGARARSKVLENDMNSLKTKINSLMEKSEHDDQLIKVLTGEINVVESNYKDKVQSLKDQFEKLQNQHNLLQLDVKRERERQDNLQKLLIERETKIDDLKSQIREYQNQKMSASSTIISNEAIKEHFHKTTMDSEEERAIYRAADLERKRLLEMVSTLNIRLDNIRGKLDEVQLNLKREKQKSNKLTMKINRLESEKTMNRPATYARGSTSRVNSTNSFSEPPDPSEELKNKLEICEEQILLLQSRVQTLEEEKKIDLENFAIMLENTRNIFHEELLQNKIEED